MARWFAMSTQFLTDPKVERMIDRHGNDALGVTLALFAQAMLQERGGTVVRSYRTLAKEGNVDRETAVAVVATASEVGFLTLDSSDDFEFEATFPAWSRHQANYRKAKSRAKEKEADKPLTDANVTDSHGESRAVPKCHSQDKTRQERRRQEKTTTAKSPGVPPDNAPGGKAEFEEWLTHFHQVTGRASVTGSDDARRKFKARRKTHSLEDLKAATVGCQSDPWRVEKGHNKPETILRSSNVEGYISQAKDQAPQVRPHRQTAEERGMDNARAWAEEAKRLEALERQEAAA